MTGDAARRAAGSRAAGAASTRSGTSGYGTRRRRRCSTWPRDVLAAARPRGCTSGWSTTTRSRPTCGLHVDPARSARPVHVMATASPAATWRAVEKAVDEELARFLRRRARRRPSSTRAKTRTPGRLRARRRAHRRLRRQVGHARARARSIGGRPGLLQADRSGRAAATPASVPRRGAALAERWRLRARGRTRSRRADGGGDRRDRTKLPEAGGPPGRLPARSTRRPCPNGLKVSSPSATRCPMVRLDLLVDAGYAADQRGSARAARACAWRCSTRERRRATRSRSPTSSQRLGAELDAGSNLDTAVVTMSALKANLDPSLALYADVVLNPAFPEATSSGSEAAAGRASSRRRSQPVGMACACCRGCSTARLTPTRRRSPGSGTEAAVARMTRDDLVEFHRTWFKPNNATLVVVGRHDARRVSPCSSGCSRAGRRRRCREEHRPSAPAGEDAVYLLDRPGADSR